MNLLLVAGKMDNGGAETHIFDLAMGLMERGHKITLVSSGGKIADKMKKCGVECLTLTLHRRSVPYLIKAYSALFRIIDGKNFDVVHSHTRLSSFIVSPICQKKGVPLVTTAHAKFSVGGISDRLSRWGDATIAVGQDIKQHLILHSDLTPDNVTVLLNGIDTEKFSPREERSEKRICFLSRLDLDCSSVAFSLCRIAPLIVEKYGDVIIDIGGDGELFEAVRQTAREINENIGREIVHTVGRAENASEFLNGTTVFVGVSRSALEAMSCGIPTIFAGDEGFLGLAEGERLDKARLSNYCCRGAEKAEDGRLFEELCDVLSKDNTQLDRLSKESREYVIRRHSFKSMAQMTEQVYERVVREEKHGKKILLCGYYGFGNLGDDALLRSAAERARAEYPDCTVTALTRWGDNDRRIFGIRCVKRSNPFSVAKEIKKADIVIFGGGTLLQNATSRRSLMYYLKILSYAQKNGVDTLLWGNGIGRIKGEYFRKKTAYVLSRCVYLGVRDDGSAEEVKRLFHKYSLPCKVFREDDLAINTPPCDSDRLAYLLSELGVSEGDKIIAVAVRGKEEEKYIKEMESCVKNLCKEGAIPVYIPMFPSEDLKVSREIIKRRGGRIAYPIGVADARGLIERAEQVVAMRYHALVFAYAANTPFKSIGSQPKLYRFCRSYGTRNKPCKK